MRDPDRKSARARRKAQRVAQLAAMERDPVGAALAIEVFETVQVTRREESRLPVTVEAPLIVAAERAARGIAKRDGVEVTEDAINDRAAYLVRVFFEAVIHATPDVIAKSAADVRAASS